MTRTFHAALAATLTWALAAPVHAQIVSRPRSPVVAGSTVQVRLDTSRLRRDATLASPPTARATAQAATQEAPAPQTAASATISRARLQQVLGASSTLRVVRATGVSDLDPKAASVAVAPGDFVFRKLSDTARRVVRTGETAVPPRPAPEVGRPPRATPDIVTAPPPAPDVGPRPGATPEVPVTTAGPPSSLPASSAAYAMPYRWMTVDSAGVERVLMPYFIIIGGGLSYDVASRMYRGLALVGVEDTLHASADAVTLARPLRMQLATMRGGRISPPQIAIAHTSLEYDSVRIESPDATVVRIRTGADPEGIVIPIPVLGIAVALTPQQRTLQGFGLATTDIGVSLPRGMARTDTAVVNFSSTGSPVRPERVRVTGAEGATVRLRSGRLGPDTVRAFIDGVEVGHTEVVSQMPISFLVATLLGILLGGAARFVSAKRRKRARYLSWDIIKGAPFGLLAAIAGAVGLDLAQLKIGEPGALPAIMVTATIGAWLGAKLLARGDTAAQARAA